MEGLVNHMGGWQESISLLLPFTPVCYTLRPAMLYTAAYTLQLSDAISYVPLY